MSKAIVLFSGGLDSLLAVRVLQQQNIDVAALTVVTPFHDCSVVAGEKAEHLGIPLHEHRFGTDYVNMVAAPKFGYGKAMNPCIDCRIAMCTTAKHLMEQVGADFVATGEIAGQRPNSQKQHQLALIARESGLAGRLVRPLSAKVLAPTIPEHDGVLARDKLYAFTGRGRTPLHSLARRLDVGKIPQPSTGCLLCEKSYVPKLRDLLHYRNDPNEWDVAVLAAGRQLRISPNISCTMGRNLRGCLALQELFERPDARASVIMIPENFNGPTTLFVGLSPEHCSPEEFEKHLDLAGALTLRFTNPGKYDPENAVVLVRYANQRRLRTVAPDDDARNYKVLSE